MRCLAYAGSGLALIGALLTAGCGSSNSGRVLGLGGARGSSNPPSATGSDGTPGTSPSTGASLARPVAPLSGGALSTSTPVLHFQLDPGGGLTPSP